VTVESELKQCKRAIRIFLRTAYTNERLAWLLVHARSGKLAYQSCCCLVGLPTADHALAGKMSSKQISKSRHYWIAKAFLGAAEAEWAFYRLGLIRRAGLDSSDELRRRRLIPMVLAEIWRRARKKDRSPRVWSSSTENAERRGVRLLVT
jgi:hypothetical protein